MSKKASNKKVEHFVATASIMGKKHSGGGETVYEALASITPGNIAGKVILVVEHGKNKKERVLPAPICKRAYNLIGLNREVALKQLAGMFDGI